MVLLALNSLKTFIILHFKPDFYMRKIYNYICDTEADSVRQCRDRKSRLKVSKGSIYCDQAWFFKFKGSVFCDARTFQASSDGIKSPQLDKI